MEDFDVFTNEIDFTKPAYKNILNKYAKEIPSTPSGPNYQSSRKLLAEECLSEGNDLEAAFYFSEAVSASLRTLATYRDEQLRSAKDKMLKITSLIKPVQDLIEKNPLHGDLSKYQSGPQDRIKCDFLWKEVTNQLNAVDGGVERSAEKWKKVWADWKSKTKRKYLLMRKHPGKIIHLTVLEKRVVALLGKSSLKKRVTATLLTHQEQHIKKSPQSPNDVSEDGVLCDEDTTNGVYIVMDTTDTQACDSLIHSSSEEEQTLLSFLPDVADVTEQLKKFAVTDELPFYKKYMRIGPDNNVDNMRRILEELPKEWTVVQLTAPYDPDENLKPLPEYRAAVAAVYVTLYRNEYVTADNGPITVTVPANVVKEGEKPLFTELYSILEENYRTIDNAQFLNNKRLVQNYWSKREDIDLRMKSVINVMDKHWLGGWGTLLTGRLRDSALRDKVVRLVDDAANDWGFIRLSRKQKILLYNLVDSSVTLSSEQLKSCVRRILTEHGDLEEMRRILNNLHCDTCDGDFRFVTEKCFKCLSKCFEEMHHFSVVDGIRAFSQVVAQVRDGDEWEALRKAKRYPVILIVDEMLDTFPWETLPILYHHPVCRMENIHFLYALYKIHEKDIVDGYFTTKAEEGRYVINPEKNLERMELRMGAFVRYWCGGWRGHVGAPPPPDDFLSYLTDADMFLYCGHGDGCQFAAGGRGAGGGAGVEGATGARAVALLSGCGSARLVQPPGRAPPSAAHHHLHVAGCPMVIGMLWEVTDLEVDKVVSALLALCVPSDAPADWASVGKAKWSQGQLDISSGGAGAGAGAGERRAERDVLRAVSRARAATSFTMIASSVVARGLPVAVAVAHPLDTRVTS